MRFVLTVSMMLFASVAARAETFSFSFGGQTIHIGVAGGCSDMSCVSVNVPGYFSHNATGAEPRRVTRGQSARQAEPRRAAKPKPVKPAAEPQVAAAPATAPQSTPPAKPAAEPQVAAVPPAVAVAEPVPAASSTRSLGTVEPPVATAAAPPMLAGRPAAAAVAPVEEAKPAIEAAPGLSAAVEPAAEPKPADQPVTAPAAAAATPAIDLAEPKPAAEPDSKSMVIAALPPVKQQAEEAAKEAAPAPVGMWSGSDGKLKIEPCGQYLCGYAAGGRHAGKLILINMKQTKANHWSGRVKDFGSGGVYSASMFMRGTNSLRIQGCAFGGMICDGRTLARSN
jgi:uncharacterized protein (DUF2147 family)